MKNIINNNIDSFNNHISILIGKKSIFKKDELLLAIGASSPSINSLIRFIIKDLPYLERNILRESIQYININNKFKKYLFFTISDFFINENENKINDILYSKKYKLISFNLIMGNHITSYIKDTKNDIWYHYDDMKNEIIKVEISKVFQIIINSNKTAVSKHDVFACYELQDKKNITVIDLICNIINH